MLVGFMKASCGLVWLPCDTCASMFRFTLSKREGALRKGDSLGNMPTTSYKAA